MYDIPPPPAHPETGPAPAAPPPPADTDGPDPVLVEGIAYVCHEANRVLQIMNADSSIPVSPHWDDLDAETRESVIDGVHKVITERLTPAQSHENWVKFKVEHGWTYGPIKDEEKKEHPNLVPYGELSEAEKRKDRLFHAIVRTMAVEETTEAITGYLTIIDTEGRSVGVIEPQDVVYFEFRRPADLNDLHRASTETARDAQLQMQAQVSLQVGLRPLVENVVQNMMQAQMHVAQQLTEAKQEAEIRKQLLLDARGGHKGKGGKSR